MVEILTRTKISSENLMHLYIFLKNSKHANYFHDHMSSISLKREFGALEHGWCCDYPMEGQIFAYTQLPMVIMSCV